MCSWVQNVVPNNQCSKEVVKNYIVEECNGKKMNCMPFYRSTDISENCKGAFKYVALWYSCGEYLL